MFDILIFYNININNINNVFIYKLYFNINN